MSEEMKSAIRAALESGKTSRLRNSGNASMEVKLEAADGSFISFTLPIGAAITFRNRGTFTGCDVTFNNDAIGNMEMDIN